MSELSSQQIRKIGTDILDRPLNEEEVDFLLERGFKFNKTIGCGRYGEVWDVWCSRLGCSIACKIMMISKFPQYFTFDKCFEEIKNETQIHRSLNHENVVKLEEVVYIDDKPSSLPCIYAFLFMELCEGDLRQLIYETNDGYMSPSQSHEWFSQVVVGLKYLHDNRISHLDIKPTNILYKTQSNGKRVFKLTDFGLSKVFKEDEPNIGTELRGTFTYLPPEVINFGNYFRHVFNRRLSYETKPIDIYSLAITLSESLIGKRGQSQEVVGAAQRRSYASLTQYGVDERLAELIEAMTQTDPRQRITIDEVCLHFWVTSYTTRPFVVTRQPNR